MKRGCLKWLLPVVALTLGFLICDIVHAGGLQAAFKGVRDPCDAGLRIPETIYESCARVDGSNVLQDVSGHNLLTDRTEIDDWAVSGTCAVTADVYRNPVDGTKDADLLDNTGGANTDYRYLNSTSTTSNPHNGSIWVRVNTPHNVTVAVWEQGIGGVSEIVFAATQQWRRIDTSGVGTGVGLIGVRLYPGERGVSTGAAYFSGAQLVTCGQMPCSRGFYLNPPDQSVTKPALHLAATGTPSRTVSSFQGMDGNRVEARALNGTTDYYSTTHHDSMNLNDSDHTYTLLWERTDDGTTDTRRIFGHGFFNADGLYIQHFHGTGLMQAVYSKAAAVIGVNNTDSTSSSRWHVSQLVRSGDVATLYHDGVAGTPVNVATYGIDGDRTLYVGWDGVGNRWAGEFVYTRIDAKAASPDKLAHDREVLTGIVSNLTAVPREDVIVDGDMEAVGVGAWTLGNDVILTKETGSPFSGVQVLRVAHDGLDHPYAYQVILTLGTYNRITGHARGDGTAHPRLVIDGVYVWIGATSTDWQAFDIVISAQNTSLVLMARTTAASYVEFDDVYVIEYSPSIADFSRATTAYATFSDMSMAEFPVDVPRVAGDGGGVFIEGPTTNKLLQSQDFSTTWTTTQATVSTDIAVAPDGKTTVDGIVGSAITSDHGVCQNQTVLTTEPWTYHIWARPGDQDWLYLHSTTIANANAFFDIANVHVGTLGAGVDDYGIEPAWGGFYHAWIVFTGTVALHTFCVYSAEANNDTQFLGDGGTINTYVWQAQVEPGTFPTSIIPTTTTEVTRAADSFTYDPHPPNSTEIILPEFFTPTGNATELTIEFDAKCEWSGLADIGTVERRFQTISGLAGTASATRNRFRVYVSVTGRVFMDFRDDDTGQHYVYSAVDPVDFSGWFTVKGYLDFSDLSNMELWINGSNAGMTYSGNIGTATFDTTNTLIRKGQLYDGTVNAHCRIRNDRVQPYQF